MFLESLRGDYVRRREDILEREQHSWEKKPPNYDNFHREEASRVVLSCHSGGYKCVGECFDGPFREVVFPHHGSQPVQIPLPKGSIKPAKL